VISIKSSQEGPCPSHHCEPPRKQFLLDTLSGLQSSPKRLNCKYFYDQRGSQLFDQICETDDYYLTRTETSIMQQHAQEMGECLGEKVMLVEFGSGSSLKTQYLLNHLIDPAAYVPVDISRDHLLKSADRISQEHPGLEVLPVYADFTQSFSLPAPSQPHSHAAVYFPGSTIGNFEPESGQRLLKTIAQLCGRQGGLLIGIDLKKNRQVLENAYDDRQGITADFNLNLLRRMNRELDADFDLDAFKHRAIYNEQLGRIEIYIESLADQTVSLGNQTVFFERGEYVHTENSHKYTIDGFSQLAAEAGWTLRKAWTDSRNYFAVLHFVVL